MRIRMLAILGAMACATFSIRTAAEPHPQIMLPVVRFAVAGEDCSAEFGFLAANGDFLIAAREAIPRRPAKASPDTYWIETEKLDVIRQMQPPGITAFQFGPENIEWRSKQWSKVAVTEKASGGHRNNLACSVAGVRQHRLTSE